MLEVSSGAIFANYALTIQVSYLKVKRATFTSVIFCRILQILTLHLR